MRNHGKGFAMKITGWTIWSVAMMLAAASTGICADNHGDSLTENFSQLEAAIQSAKEQANQGTTESKFHWAELENFQTALWRAMALDPSTVLPVPPAQVPKELFAVELNTDLSKQLAELRKSTVPKNFHAEAEFSQYLTAVDHLVGQRRMRQFPQARAFAKRGFLDSVYQPLQAKLLSAPETSTVPAIPALLQIEDTTRDLKKQMNAASPKEIAKKDLFANGTQFIWYMIAAIFGFFIGLAGYRLNPDFFQKFLDQIDSTAPTATTHSAGAAKLDYARWLREFEEILSRLKSSQMTLERRIEGIVQNSEKISQHSLSLYADARIKNEANLEYRMSTLVRDVQNQFDQSQKLQAGDRVQVNVMLEHCLKLCDAIESNAIHLDRIKLAEVPPQRMA